MSQKNTKRESRWLDYVLVTAMSGFAIFTAGQGTQVIGTSSFLIGILVIGSIWSYFAGKAFQGTILVNFDSWIYVFVSLSAFLFPGFLNSLLPTDPFPADVETAGILSWMLALGSFGMLRDGPLLFQAVPGLALFGLIGVYDTYSKTTFLFFGYMLCLALLLGRAHARAMVKSAMRSGYAKTEEGVSLSEKIDEQDMVLRAMRRGPWRWMAGPEWALGSALVIIAVSWFGAPILRNSVKNVTSFVRYNAPKSAIKNNPLNQASPTSGSTLSTVGNGSISLSKRVVLLATLDRATYLRMNTYTVFSQKDWRTTTSETESYDANSDQDNIPQFRKSELGLIEKPVYLPFEIDLLDPTFKTFPLPIEVYKVTKPAKGFMNPWDGAVLTRNNSDDDGTLSKGTYVKSGLDLNDPKVQDRLSSAPDENSAEVSPRVAAWAKKVVMRDSNDYSRAVDLTMAIGKQANYDLNAPAIPADADVVDTFLFKNRRGYCDLFATAVVQTARSIGLSARYATGFLVNPDSKNSDGQYVVRESDAHAWAEIWFSSVGWVPFDATEYAQDVTYNGNPATKYWLWGIGIFGIGGAGLAVFAAKNWTRILKAFARNPQQRVESVNKRRLGRAYERFEKLVQKRTGIWRLPSETPDEFMARAGTDLGTERDRFSAVNQSLVNALYGQSSVGESELAVLESQVKSLTKG